MSDLYRFDVDYIDEEQGMKHIPCDNGDYVLAEDALALQATITKLTADNANLVEKNAFLRQRPDLPVDRIPAYTAMQAKVYEMIKVMEAARDDLLMRGDIDSQGCRVVNMSATTWNNFCGAIDKAALKEEGRLERSLSRSTAFPASQAALKQEDE